MREISNVWWRGSRKRPRKGLACVQCALSGYMLDGIEELHRLAEPVPGPSISRIAEVCAHQRVHTGRPAAGTGSRGLLQFCRAGRARRTHRLLPESSSAGARARSHGGAWQHSFRRARYANRAYRDGDLLRHPISRADATARAARRRHRGLPLQLAVSRAAGAAVGDPRRPDARPRHRESRVPGGAPTALAWNAAAGSLGAPSWSTCSARS